MYLQLEYLKKKSYNPRKLLRHKRPEFTFGKDPPYTKEIDQYGKLPQGIA